MWPFLHTVWQLKWAFQSILLGGVVLLALWRGAAPERATALTFAAMFVADRAYHQLLGPGIFYLQVNLGHLGIDLASLAAFALISLKANRMYPIWITGFQLIALVSHLVQSINPAIAAGAYAVLMIVPSYLQIGSFAAGLWLHLRRQKLIGQYRSWQD